jgi:hypothetical protein
MTRQNGAVREGGRFVFTGPKDEGPLLAPAAERRRGRLRSVTERVPALSWISRRAGSGHLDAGRGHVRLLRRGRRPWSELGPQKSRPLLREAGHDQMSLFAGAPHHQAADNGEGTPKPAAPRTGHRNGGPAISSPDGPKGRHSARSKKVRIRRSPLRCDPKITP